MCRKRLLNGPTRFNAVNAGQETATPVLIAVACHFRASRAARPLPVEYDEDLQVYQVPMAYTF